MDKIVFVFFFKFIQLIKICKSLNKYKNYKQYQMSIVQWHFVHPNIQGWRCYGNYNNSNPIIPVSKCLPRARIPRETMELRELFLFATSFRAIDLGFPLTYLFVKRSFSLTISPRCFSIKRRSDDFIF